LAPLPKMCIPMSRQAVPILYLFLLSLILNPSSSRPRRPHRHIQGRQEHTLPSTGGSWRSRHTQPPFLPNSMHTRPLTRPSPCIHSLATSSAISLPRVVATSCHRLSLPVRFSLLLLQFPMFPSSLFDILTATVRQYTDLCLY
jgi:hypothetical protein